MWDSAGNKYLDLAGSAVVLSRASRRSTNFARKRFDKIAANLPPPPDHSLSRSNRLSIKSLCCDAIFMFALQYRSVVQNWTPGQWWTGPPIALEEDGNHDRYRKRFRRRSV